MPYKLKVNNEIMLSEVSFKVGESQAIEISQEEYEQLANEKQALREKEERKQEILLQLNEIDNKSIRALRNNETDRLQDLEKQAEKLRQEIKKEYFDEY